MGKGRVSVEVLSARCGWCSRTEASTPTNAAITLIAQKRRDKGRDAARVGAPGTARLRFRYVSIGQVAGRATGLVERMSPRLGRTSPVS
jgi:hypothetical protein